MALLDIKVGDKVFCIHHGWGTVEIISADMTFPIGVLFTSRCTTHEWYDMNGKLYEFMNPSLSYTEYSLEGFTQERPEELPEKGDVVWVRNAGEKEYLIGHFHEKTEDGKYAISFRNPFTRNFGWKFDELTSINPYKK